MWIGDGPRNFATFWIGSNHLEVFPETGTSQKYIKSLNSAYETVGFLVYLQAQGLQLYLKSTCSRVFFKNFTKILKNLLLY